jgi:hypothetical protein
MNPLFRLFLRTGLLLGGVLAVSVMAQTTEPLATVQPMQSTATQLRNSAVDQLSPAEAVALFKTLPAPTMEEMNGEFSGEMLSFPSLYTRLFWTIASKNPIYPGIWQGKSFRQTGVGKGVGYNTVKRWIGGQVDMWPMLTQIAPSYFGPVRVLIFSGRLSAFLQT